MEDLGRTGKILEDLGRSWQRGVLQRDRRGAGACVKAWRALHWGVDLYSPSVGGRTSVEIARCGLVASGKGDCTLGLRGIVEHSLSRRPRRWVSRNQGGGQGVRVPCTRLPAEAGGRNRKQTEAGGSKQKQGKQVEANSTRKRPRHTSIRFAVPVPAVVPLALMDHRGSELRATAALILSDITTCGL